MSKFIHFMTGVLIALILNGFGFVGHAAAMPIHDMHEMGHDQANTSTCATLCRTAVIETNVSSKNDEQDQNDDEPIIPYYLQLQSRYIAGAEQLTKTCQSTIKPPPKVPIHILHCVSRS